jgi:hypothetical protein
MGVGTAWKEETSRVENINESSRGKKIYIQVEENVYSQKKLL